MACSKQKFPLKKVQRQLSSSNQVCPICSLNNRVDVVVVCPLLQLNRLATLGPEPQSSPDKSEQTTAPVHGGWQ